MSNAIAGHGASLAIELSPVSGGSFTVVGEATDIGWPELSRPSDEVTPHNEGIDSYVLGTKQRGPLSLTVNFIYDNSTHDHSTGLIKHWISNTKFGVRLRGPSGTTDTDEWIASGQVESFQQVTPVRQGARTADISIRLSGAMKIDGTTVS